MDAAFAMPSRGMLSAKGTPVTGSTFTKGFDGDLPKAKDMSHHLSALAKNRSPSSLKELYRYANLKGMGE